MRPNSHIRNKFDTTSREPTGFLEEPLVLRLLNDFQRLPAGFCYSVPVHATCMLVRQRLATVVGTLGIIADVVLNEDDWEAATA